MIRSWQNKTKCTKKDLLSLAGWMFWATKVVRGGRTFLRRILDAAHSRSANILLPVEPSVLGDLEWWDKFVHNFNGTSMIPDSHWTESWGSEFQLYTDASGSGYGAQWGNKYVYGQWNGFQKQIVRRDTGIAITVLELCGVVIAALTWGHLWKGKRIVVRCDNTGAVAAINSMFCKDPTLMQLVRELWFASCTHLFELRSIHVAGVLNVNADLLSRGRIQEFLSLNPTADSCPNTPVMPTFLNL